jgi:4'-phosphopantetheinyl transferase
MIKVYYAYSELANEDCLKWQVEPLSKKALLRLAGLKRKEDRILMLTALYLLKKALLQSGNSDYQLQNLQYSQSGRPFFEGAAFDFNISHTEQCSAVAFAQDSRVGIDIERIKAIDFADFENIFSLEVWKSINTSEAITSSFYFYWTLLESAVKADGRGLPLIASNKLEIRTNPIEIDGTKWYFQHQYFNSSISCCISSDRKQIIVELNEVKLPLNEPAP